MSSVRQFFSQLNVALVLGGIAGALTYFFLLPLVHPDARQTRPISGEEAISAAENYLDTLGYGSTPFTWKVHYRREATLLDTLSQQMSVRELQTDMQALPLYYWHVTGQPQSSTDSESRTLSMNISADGRVWEFSPDPSQAPMANRAALQAVLNGISDTTRFDPSTSIDSLSRAPLIFMLRPMPGMRDSQAQPPPPEDPRLPVLFREDAIAMAHFHLQQTLFEAYSMQVDSVFRLDNFDRNRVRVRFVGQIDAPGVALYTDVDLLANGALAGISTAFEPVSPRETESSGNSVSFDFSLDVIPEYLKILGYIIILVLSLVLFIRRLSARLIDVKSAIQDAIWGAIFLGGMIGNKVGWEIVQDADSFWNGALMAGLLTLVTASLSAFFVFIVSCGADSISRFTWSGKLATLSMSRNLQFRNAPFGRSIIHGACFGFILLGLQTLFLFLPGLHIVYQSNMETFVSEETFSPLAQAVFSSGIYSMMYGMLILLSVGSALYVKWTNRIISVAGVVAIFTLLQLSSVHVAPVSFQWALSATIGLIVALAFHRFDYLTVFQALFVYGIVWELTPGWLAPAAAFAGHVWAGLLLILGSIAVGLVGLYSGREFSDTDSFVPGYIKEIAQQERLRSELDIATHVQASLLPHSMPEMPDLDIAAMCLPAQEVGGDYFDFIRLDEHRVALVIGDVSGKGIQAAFFMTLTKGFIHAICREETSPARLLTRVNELFCQNAPRGTFISLIYGIFDTANDTFVFARAGHDPVLHRTGAQRPRFIQPQGIAIGLVADDTFRNNIADQTLELAPDDLIVFYTDGVTEAVNPKKEQFGSDRLATLVHEARSNRSSMILQHISQQIQMFVKAESRHDDMTIIIVRRAGRTLSTPLDASDG